MGRDYPLLREEISSLKSKQSGQCRRWPTFCSRRSQLPVGRSSRLSALVGCSFRRAVEKQLQGDWCTSEILRVADWLCTENHVCFLVRTNEKRITLPTHGLTHDSGFARSAVHMFQTAKCMKNELLPHACMSAKFLCPSCELLTRRPDLSPALGAEKGRVDLGAAS